MNAQSTFFVSGPEYVSGDFFSTNTGNLGSSAQSFRNIYLTGTGYGYSQEVIYNGRSEEVITRAEVTGRFIANYLTGDFPVQYVTGLVTGLTFPLAADKTYKLEYRLQYSGSSNLEGINISLSGINPCAFFAGNGLIDDFNNTPEGFVVSGYNPHGHFHGATDRRMITLNVLLVNSSSANSLSLYAGKETSGVNTVALCSGSWATMTQY